MKLRVASAEQGPTDEIDITPLVDVIFLLVLFFMFTSSFIEEAKVFKIVLPKADEPLTVARDDADVISVTVDGEYYFRGVKPEQEEIKDLPKLIERLGERPNPRPVIVRCDARCEYRDFVQVKNALKLAGVETIFEEVAEKREAESE